MSEYFLQAALRSSLLLGLGALVWPLLPAHLPVWRRRILLVFFVALLLGPFLPTAFSTVAAAEQSPVSTDSLAGRLPWHLIWIVGSAGALLRLGWKTLGLRRLVHRARDLGQLEFADCRLRLKESAAVHAPCVTGWYRTTLLVPPGSETWDQPRWQCVLWHERQHALQHDVCALWLVRLSTALYWWNPFVHLAARQFHIESEASCDAAVLRAGTVPRTYVETLLSFTGSPHLLTLSLAGKSALRKRIARFLGAQIHSRAARWRLLGGMTLAVVVAGFSSLCGLKSQPHAPTALEAEGALRFSANPFPSDQASSETGPFSVP